MNDHAAVVIPTRNRCELLNATLASLAEQAGPSFDVVVADHGSTDGTWEVVQRWSPSLRLAYARLPPWPRSPGWVRDEGTRATSADLFIFLDSGMAVPPTFVRAHLAFHRAKSAVGIGMCHGYRVYGRPGAEWPRLLRTQPIARLRRLIEADSELRDERFGIPDFEQLKSAWVYGWSGNLSVGRELYASVKGFDREREGIYEDVDLSYRLHIRGASFGIVHDGWAIHLPHPCAPLPDQVRSARAGWRLSYSQHRSLALEAAWLATPTFLTWRAALPEYGKHIDAMARSLESVVAGAPAADVTPRRLGLTGRVLLVGGRPRDANHFDHVACGRGDLHGGEKVWGCAGVLIPLPSDSLDAVVVTDVWRRLSAQAGGRRLLDHLAAEIARTGATAVFLDSGAARADDLTSDDVASACARHRIAWRIARMP
jgi:Glycosyl transferase family 2